MCVRARIRIGCIPRTFFEYGTYIHTYIHTNVQLLVALITLAQKSRARRLVNLSLARSRVSVLKGVKLHFKQNFKERHANE